MGKKDDEIVRLKKELSASKVERDKLEVVVENGTKTVNDLEEMNTALAETSQQLAGDVNALNEDKKKMIADFQKKIQEMTDYRQLMVLNVNVSGVQDIDKCLSDAVSLVTKRLEELEKQDDYVLLAVPHTMAIDIPR